MQRVWGERAGSLGEMKEWRRKRKLVFRGLCRGYYGTMGSLRHTALSSAADAYGYAGFRIVQNLGLEFSI